MIEIILSMYAIAASIVAGLLYKELKDEIKQADQNRFADRVYLDERITELENKIKEYDERTRTTNDKGF